MLVARQVGTGIGRLLMENEMHLLALTCDGPCPPGLELLFGLQFVAPILLAILGVFLLLVGLTR